MRPLYVVNNYGQFNHLIARTLRDIGIAAEIVSNEVPPEHMAQGCRGIILGGGPTMDRSGMCPQYLDLGLPVLGICLGFQIIAITRGGAVRKGRAGGYGLVEVQIDEHNDILEGYADHIRVWASHADEVSLAPEGFRVLAHSDISQIEAIGNETKHIYGVQWHPEVSHTENGRLVFENFNRICQR
ncbi:MAG: GMP synthase subunit A [Methanomicrobiales archaeon]|nr:GMP synthase subunit A [Methanomicrobiales archaeon]